ncbi:MAG: hypothetical protein JSW71_18375 [Gemmatimonadota bacterium]|nr:MAG: hypothetical protein JSW71_18375 [Gemmatimonadota bacterium]
MRTKSPLSNPGNLTWAVSLSLAACSPPAHWVAVAGADTQEIVLFNSDLSLDHRTSLSAPDFGDARILTAVLARDGASFFVIDSGPTGNHLSLIRRSDGHVLERHDFPPALTPRTLTPTPDARTLIVTTSSATDARAGTISLLHTDSFTERSTVEPCRGYPEDMAVLPELERGYVRCHGDEATVVEVDLSLGRVVKTAAPDPRPGTVPRESRCGSGGIALSPSGSILLLPCSSSGILLYLDRMTLEVLDSVPVGAGAHQIAVSPRGAVALLAYPDSGAASLVDLARRRTIAQITTPGSPSAVAISGDGTMGYILLTRVDSAPGALMRLDLRTQEVLNTVAVAPGSRSLAVWPGRWSPTMRWR